MALYSTQIKLSNTAFMCNSKGTLSADSYILVEVTGVKTSLGKTIATVQYSLYGKSSKQRSCECHIWANTQSFNQTVTITTSMTKLISKTVNIECNDAIQVSVTGDITYIEKGTGVGGVVSGSYGISTSASLMDMKNISFVTFGTPSSYPSSLKFGGNGTFNFSKSASYKMEFYGNKGVVKTVSFTGTNTSVTFESAIFKNYGNISGFTLYEYNQNTLIHYQQYTIKVTEKSCFLNVTATRTDDNSDNVTLLVNGWSAECSTSRTISFYVKETSATEWTPLSTTISPQTASFSNEECSISLSIDYAWDVYGVLDDGYTTYQSNIVKLYSKSYIMDVRKDGKGIAFGGTASYEDEMYCGFKNFRARNVITDSLTVANKQISFDTIYPVGSIYMSVNNTSPTDLFGGTWERLGGRFLLGADSTYSAGSTGGEATHTLTTAEMPSHNHSGSTNTTGSHTHSFGSNEYIHSTNDGNTGADGGDNVAGDKYKYPRSTSSSSYHHLSATNSSGDHSHSFSTSSVGGNSAHNNMPPYLVVHMWKRTA